MKLLHFLNLLSHDKTLSLTNILFYVAMIVFILHPQVSTVAGLLVTCLNYVHKRHVNDNRQKVNDTVEQSVKDIADEIDNINAQLTSHSNDTKALTDSLNKTNQDVQLVIEANNKTLESVSNMILDTNQKVANLVSATTMKDL